MISFTNAHSPVYVTPEKDRIVLIVKFDHFEEEVEFVACLTDVEPHGPELFKRAVSGEFGPVGDYVVPVVDEEQRKIMFKDQVTFMLETQARRLNFESLAEALTFCDEDAVPLYQKQALALRKWRSLAWAWYDDMVAQGKDTDVASFDTMPKFDMLG